MRFAAAYGVAVAGFLAACGPVPVEQAEEICLRDAELAAAPRGEVGVGIGSGGARSTIKLELSGDYLTGRDPSQVYARCVSNKSGQLPTRPLTSRTDWKG
ncbi:hypothetical protein [Albirhodobacter sp. R86504]|jgi:hypothetical protein|uniref:hypothetical protein n=1 Tax=Albirhodobacter sp. R86504 TaxID=3093848 RepID=UPI00366F800A